MQNNHDNTHNNNYSVIVGLGATGLSCAHYLQKQHKNFVVIDTRAHPPHAEQFSDLFPHIKTFFENIPQEVLLGADEIILSPGIPPRHALFNESRARGIPHFGDIELFVRAAQAPIIAITGSNGKSTVTSLVAHVLTEAGLSIAVGGNLGIPALDLLGTVTIPDWYVLELSSFQLEITQSLGKHIACILNITPDHMDRYARVEDYIAAKQRIYQNCSVAVFNADDANTMPQGTLPPRSIQFTTHTPAADQFGVQKHEEHYWLQYGDTQLLPTRELHIHGMHNYVNAAAALALCSATGVSLTRLLPGLKTFRGLPHRCEWVATHHDIAWYNDSKGTNVDATRAALAGFGAAITGKIIWLAGGQGKGADFLELQSYAHQYVRCALLFGEDAPQLERALNGHCILQHVDTLQQAIKRAAELAQPGDIVLLSPACASFDMFRNFEDRGAQFKHYVKDLLHV